MITFLFKSAYDETDRNEEIHLTHDYEIIYPSSDSVEEISKPIIRKSNEILTDDEKKITPKSIVNKIYRLFAMALKNKKMNNISQKNI
jgi:hypothetical protein